MSLKRIERYNAVTSTSADSKDIMPGLLQGGGVRVRQYAEPPPPRHKDLRNARSGEVKTAPHILRGVFVGQRAFCKEKALAGFPMGIPDLHCNKISLTPSKAKILTKILDTFHKKQALSSTQARNPACIMPSSHFGKYTYHTHA